MVLQCQTFKKIRVTYFWTKGVVKDTCRSFVNMEKQLIVLVFLYTSVAVVLGLVSLTCDTFTPTDGSDLVCMCISDQDIEWLNETAVISQCNSAGACLPASPPGYSLAYNSGTNHAYDITILSYNFYSCGTYKCQIFGTSTNSHVDIGITSELDTSTPPDVVEPASGSHGTITVTTTCISPSTAKAISSVKWYQVYSDPSKDPLELSTNVASNQISCDTSCGFKSQTQYTYTKPTDNSTAEEVNLRVIYSTKDGGELIWTSTNTYLIEKTEPCECKCVLDGGKIAYIIIDCLLDVGFCVAAFFLTCQRFSGGKRPEGVIKNALIGIFVAVVVLLDIGLTIYYLAQDCGDDCSDECNSKCCTKGLRIGLTVVAWIPFDIAGYVMIVRYFISGGESVPAWNQTRSNGTGGVGATAKSDTATSPAHARNDAKNGGGKRAQPLPPSVSKPLPSIGGMGNRGLSAYFEDNSGMTPPEGRGGQVRLQPLKPAGDTIVESDETEKKKKKKRKKTRV